MHSKTEPYLLVYFAMTDDEAVFHIHGIGFDPALGVVSIEGESIVLTRTEFGVLQFLVQNADTTFTRQQIIAAVQGEDYPATDRTVDVQVVALRKKLGPRGKLIQTVRGKGYRFCSSPAS